LSGDALGTELFDIPLPPPLTRVEAHQPFVRQHGDELDREVRATERAFRKFVLPENIPAATLVSQQHR
jgi:hypothetical protein